jgi:type IV secretion system protein VirB8
MNEATPAVVSDRYYQDGASWEKSTNRLIRASAVMWRLVAILLALMLMAALVALWLLIPLKRTDVVVMEVDKTTGYLQVVRPLVSNDPITGNEAVTTSNIVRFIKARETYDPKGLRDNFDLASLLSTGRASEDLASTFANGNPNNPVRRFGTETTVSVEIKSVSFLNERTASVRFSTRRAMANGQQLMDHWVANVRYRYTSSPMRNDWRFDNPLGFQVFEYRKDPETVDPTVPSTMGADKP